MTQYCLPFLCSSTKPSTQAQAQAHTQASSPTSHQQGRQSQRLPFWKRWHATSQHRRSPSIITTTSVPPPSPALTPPRGYSMPPIPLMFLFENSLSSDIYDSDDDEDISEALLEEVGGNFPRARRRHRATLTWREHHGVDTIFDPYIEEKEEAEEAEVYNDEQYLAEDEDFLKAYPMTNKGSSNTTNKGSSNSAAAPNTTPSPNAFQQVLSVWPRWIQGRTLDGDVIWYEDVGKLHGSSLRQARIKPAAWAKHLALVCEYITHCFEAEADKNGRHSGWYNSAYTFDSPGDSPPSPRVTLVLNFAGITSASFFADWTVRKALRAWGHILAAHYPGLVRRVLLVNVSPALSPKALAVLRPLLLLPAVWRDKIVLVVDQAQEGEGEGASMPLCDAHRAFLAPIALNLHQQQQQVEQDVTKAPSPAKQNKKASKAMNEHLLSDVTTLIAPSVLSAAVFPGRGLNEVTAEEAHEWQTLLRFVEGKAEDQERCEKKRERDGKGNGTPVVVEAVEIKETEAETKEGDQ